MRQVCHSTGTHHYHHGNMHRKFDMCNCNAGRSNGCRECHPYFARRPTINLTCECIWIKRATHGCGGGEASSYTSPVPPPPRQTKQAPPLMIQAPSCHPGQQAMPCVSRSARSALQTYYDNHTRMHSWLSLTTVHFTHCPLVSP